MARVFWIEKLREWVEDSLWSWRNCIDYRFVQYNDNIDRLAFFEELNIGWYREYIYPYDDCYDPTISEERGDRLGGFPQQYTFYVSEVEYDRLMEKTQNPSFNELFEQKLPWD